MVSVFGKSFRRSLKNLCIPPWYSRNQWWRTRWLVVLIYGLVFFLLVAGIFTQPSSTSGPEVSGGKQYPESRHRHTHDFNLQFKEAPPKPIHDPYSFHSTMERRMQSRRDKVKEVCKRHGIQMPGSKVKAVIKHPPSPQYSVFYFVPNYKLAWCPLYKSASTSWLYSISVLGGLSEEYIQKSGQQISEIARALYPSIDGIEAQQFLNTSFRFIIVRHPFLRLLSAFRDKLENMHERPEDGTEYFYKSYGRKIVKKYRGEGAQETEPTFEEFVQYLIDTDPVYYDDHWMPYYLFCTPCFVDYDIIAQVETLDTDQEFLLQKSKLSGVVEPFWKHSFSGGSSTDKAVGSYFKRLTRSQIEGLYQRYKFDFELFEYDIDVFLQLVPLPAIEIK